MAVIKYIGGEGGVKGSGISYFYVTIDEVEVNRGNFMNGYNTPENILAYYNYNTVGNTVYVNDRLIYPLGPVWIIKGEKGLTGTVEADTVAKGLKWIITSVLPTGISNTLWYGVNPPHVPATYVDDFGKDQLAVIDTVSGAVILDQNYSAGNGEVYITTSDVTIIDQGIDTVTKINFTKKIIPKISGVIRGERGLTGTVSKVITGTVGDVRTGYLKWHITSSLPSGTANDIAYGLLYDVPATYVDSGGFDQLAVIRNTDVFLDQNYSGGVGEVARKVTDVTITDQGTDTSGTPITRLITTKAACVPNWQCIIPKTGYIHDVNSCPGSVDHIDSLCAPGTGNGACGLPICYRCDGISCIQDNTNGTFTTNACGTGCDTGTVGKVCNDPLKIGCTSGIPNTYIVVGAFVFMMMMKK